VEQVLDRLKRNGLQSDERFTETFIEGRISKGQGPIRIRQELQARGIDQALSERCLQVYREQWPSLMRRAHDAKFGPAPAADQKTLAKRARFLEYRGFPGEMIRSFLLD
jgi:regulatory protein